MRQDTDNIANGKTVRLKRIESARRFSIKHRKLKPNYVDSPTGGIAQLFVEIIPTITPQKTNPRHKLQSSRPIKAILN